MTLHRPSRSTVDDFTIVAIAAAFMAAAPIAAASAAGFGGGAGAGAGVGASAATGQASNGSGYEPSETDCVTIAQQPGRYTPDDLAACGVIPSMGGYGYYPSRG